MAPRISQTVPAEARTAPDDPVVPGAQDIAMKQQAGGAGWNPMSLTWTEQYNESLEKAWVRVPGALKKVVVMLSVFVVGMAMSGESMAIFVHARRQLGLEPMAQARAYSSVQEFFQVRFKDLGYFMLSANLVSYVLYFGIGGFLHWYFYVRQRATAAEWKCQPNSWLSPELELHEIKVGSLALIVTGSFSALLTCWIYNGGWCSVYYDIHEYGITWMFLQFPVIFLYQDYMTYWLHRMYHTPWLYKRFHKLHHTYKHPTAFSVTAIHPVEVLHIQITLCLPLFAIPVHWAPFYTIVLYTYYHGIIDHSGINFKAYWWQPWQPDCIFHDNHHQYFHVNFGFNCFFWDKIHGTYRRKDRIYREDTFYGQGKTLADATHEELAQDLQERTLENPKAYRDDKMEFLISEEEAKTISKKDQ